MRWRARTPMLTTFPSPKTSCPTRKSASKRGVRRWMPVLRGTILRRLPPLFPPNFYPATLRW
ncbi:hypothetical protein AL705_07285 [Lawsonella clevelandensis]|uniref:Uncharacterized protein n=1 Tax=Lawsonella clevelandensis TaxID=1528099 RepID=A0A0M3TBR8_9ACTN|nr:hypothetical protein AL705_07285 [Lawsonella clevelandensis]